MKISVSGLSGCGKTTLSKYLAEVFGLEYYGASKLIRDAAQQRGIPLEEFLKTHDRFQLDKIVDNSTKQLCKTKEKVVVEGRLTGWFCENADMRIWVHASLETRARRLAKRDNLPYEEAVKKIKERDEADRKAYLKLYGIDLLDLGVYDLILDTDDDDIERMNKNAEDFIKRMLLED
ncbi:MAG: AAA family ATPase [Candidatus Nanohaloarchaeota archaeon]|nr:AAA family ATPase [Candidatus Nanohaloarchaeota archaeon]